MDELLEFLRLNAPLMVSTCALFLTINSARTSRKHNRLMVQPRLSVFTQSITNSKNVTKAFDVTLTNSGLGPAIIKKYEVLIDGKPVDAEQPEDIFAALKLATTADFDPNLWHFGILRKGFVLAKDEVFTVAKTTIMNLTLAQNKEIKRFHVRVTYESAYGESSVYDTRTHLS